MKISRITENEISLLQEIPSPIFKLLLTYLKSEEKIKLRILCKKIHADLNGFFLNPIQGLTTPNYDIEEPENFTLTIPKHGAESNLMRFESLDNNQLICIYPNGLINIYDYTGENLQTIQLDGSVETLCALSSETILFYTSNHTLCLYQKIDGQLTLRLALNLDAIKNIKHACWVAKNTIGIITLEGNVECWDLTTSTLLAHTDRYQQGITSIARNADGNVIIAQHNERIYTHTILKSSDLTFLSSKNYTEKSYTSAICTLSGYRFNLFGDPVTYYRSTIGSSLTICDFGTEKIDYLCSDVDLMDNVIPLTNEDMVLIGPAEEDDDKDNFSLIIKRYPCIEEKTSSNDFTLK